MAVIPASQMALMRKRKALHQLMKTHKWEEIPRVEKQLFYDINVAFQDKQRSPKELLIELASLITVYKELSLLCHLYSKRLFL